MIDLIVTNIPQLSRSHITIGNPWRATKLGDLADRLCFRSIRSDVRAVYEGLTKAGVFVPWVSELGEDGLKFEWKEGKRSLHFEFKPGGFTYQAISGSKRSQLRRKEDDRLDFAKCTSWLLKDEVRTND